MAFEFPSYPSCPVVLPFYDEAGMWERPERWLQKGDFQGGQGTAAQPYKHGAHPHPAPVCPGWLPCPHRGSVPTEQPHHRIYGTLGTSICQGPERHS